MWRCPTCRNKVDDSFEVCWSCGTTPEGVADPDFLTADAAEPIEDPPANLSLDMDDPLADFAGTPFPELVECYMAASAVEAKFVADRLMEEDIPAIADRQDINMALGGLQPQMWGYGPKVRIRLKDLPRAKAWLETYEEGRKSKRKNEDTCTHDRRGYFGNLKWTGKSRLTWAHWAWLFLLSVSGCP
jgi:hypothetical protein